MMKASKPIITLCLSIFIYITVQACSFSPNSFCSSNDVDPSSIIIAGEVVGVDQDGIDVKVFYIFKGASVGDTIRIWDGTDFDCNGLFSMAASDLGSLGDSILVNLPVIDSLENVWDVIGQYRRPGYVTYTNELKIVNDTVTGFINGINFAPHTRLTKFPLTEFIAKWENDECPNVIVSTDDIFLNKEDFIIKNPVLDQINIQILNDIGETRKFELFTITGSKVKTIVSQANIMNWNVEELRSGIYILRIIADDNKTISYKIMKQ